MTEGGRATGGTGGALPTVAQLLERAVDSLGGTARSGQQEMATAVAEAFGNKKHLLVQAGTGTGKSLAYLVPAVRVAVSGGAPVVVATATLALQAQLVQRDLPRLADATAEALGRRPTFAVLKGRANYLCLNRLSAAAAPEADAGLFDLPEGSGGGVAASSPSRLEADVRRLRLWAERTATGDRDDLTPGVPDAAWRQVSVSARQCLGAKRCTFAEDCFAERSRERAREADVVVTNHTMLALDVITEARLLPEHTLCVVDEAHELVDRATSAATQELSASVLDRLAKRVARVVGSEASQSLSDASGALDGLLRGQDPGRVTEISETAGLTIASVRDGCGRSLAELEALEKGEAAHEGRAAQHKREPGDPADPADPASQAGAVREVRLLLTEARATAERVLARSQHDVVWVSSDARGSRSLSVAPLSVSGLLRESLLESRSVVLTSATLALGGSFTHVARAVGLRDGDQWRGLDVGSPFSYQRQAILYVGAHLPAPRRAGPSEELYRELAELVEAAGGRTLGLFSSMAAARSAAERLRETLPYPILLQGESQTSELVRRFAAEVDSCLFGTLSLWQGVDVPGGSCSLVAVDRIPFPRPDAPLASARREAVDAAGRNGFREVYLSAAALLLAQGTGRLIRSDSDRGVVAVLDPRLATSSYAGYLRASLPPFWTTTDPAVVRRSLRNLR